MGSMLSTLALFLGTNLWYAMPLGVEGPGGDRPRLVRELDRLQAVGVKQVRVMGLTQGPDQQPWRVVPAAQISPRWDAATEARFEQQMRGLDFTLSELGKRGMTAVVCLNNFWVWSGGMAQYLAWAGEGPIPYPPPAAGGSWDRFQAYATRFYENRKAQGYWEAAADRLLRRRNALTGQLYVDDAAIHSWELANEPRGGTRARAFNDWIDRTARFIKKRDPKHWVTTGSEGLTPWPEANGLDVIANHKSPAIDYVTAHLWVQNWGWYDPKATDQEGALQGALEHARAYLTRHAELAAQLGKPLVLEEFGMARDGGALDAASSTRQRDRYFEGVFGHLRDLAARGLPVAGVSFWAWSGEARPESGASGPFWRVGAPFTGDPPHEEQGWYGVYDTDASTLETLLRVRGL